MKHSMSWYELKKKEIALYMKKMPDVSRNHISSKFGIGRNTIAEWANEGWLTFSNSTNVQPRKRKIKGSSQFSKFSIERDYVYGFLHE